jgi:hypothetical protein
MVRIEVKCQLQTADSKSGVGPYEGKYFIAIGPRLYQPNRIYANNWKTVRDRRNVND